MKALKTERLILRRFRESDYDDLFECLSQLEDDEFEGYPGITYQSGREQLEYRLASDVYWAAELIKTGKVIGNICCTERPYGAVEVGYIINERFRRQGYALEALSAAIGELFREGAHRVCAECDPRNIRSWKLLEKAGMKREAHLKKNVFFHRDENGLPVWADTLIYAIGEDEYKARSLKSRAKE